MKTRSVCHHRWQRLKCVLSHSCLTNDRLIPLASSHGQNIFRMEKFTTYHEDMMNMKGELGIICGQIRQAITVVFHFHISS